MFANPNLKYFDRFVFYSIPRLFVCLLMLMSTSKQYANVYVNIHRSEVHCGSAVRFGQALPGYLITAHHACASLLYLSKLGYLITAHHLYASLLYLS